MNIPKDRFLKVNGYTVCYFDEGKGPPILLLHGWLNCKETFLPLFDKLTDSLRVIAIDIPGFGLSEQITLSPDLHEYVEMIDAFVKSLEIKSIFVLGFSFGGILTMLYNLQHQNVVQKFIVKSSPISHKQLPWLFIFPPIRFIIMQISKISLIRSIIAKFLKSYLMKLLFRKKDTSDFKAPDDIRLEIVEICKKRFSNIPFQTTGYITAKFLLYFDLQRQMKKNVRPGMFYLSRNDPLIKYQSKYYAIPYTKVALKKSRTHSILDENFDKFSHEIKNFLLSKEMNL